MLLRVVGLILLFGVVIIFIDSFKNPIHLLLQKLSQSLNHRFLNRAPFHKVSNQAINRVTFVNNDAFETKVGNVDIDEQFGLTIIKRDHLKIILELVSVV